MTSCLKDDTVEVTYTNESSIVSFSLGTLWKQFVGKAQDGSDSLYMDTLSFNEYPFTIDQLSRTIENKDSLPVGVDISRVLEGKKRQIPFGAVQTALTFRLPLQKGFPSKSCHIRDS